MKTTIVSIFDDPMALDKAINALNRSGFQERVFEPASVAQEVGHGVSPVFTPGAGPTPGGVGLAHSFPENSHDEVLRTFRSHLSDLHLSDDEIDAYVNSFDHGAKFLVVTTDKARAAEAVELLQGANASRVSRHD